MGHGQDGLSLTGQSRGENEGPVVGIPWPHQNLLTPFSGSPLPSRTDSDSSPLSTALWELAQPSSTTLSFSYAHTPCLQALHVLSPPPGVLRMHAHTHVHTCRCTHTTRG